MSRQSRIKHTNKKRKARRQPFAAPADMDGLVQVIGNPMKFGSKPNYRVATLDDCVDECELCQALRQQILDGNAPMVMAYE
jgi:hypothetical protein